MGLSSRHRQGKGRRLGGNQMSDAKRGAPLRKIVETIIFNSDLFSYNLVLLECSHEAYSNSMYRTRCEKCKKEAQEKSLDL